jgi:2-polyprenyl-6-methoxyphenol hydroxylase-like FAD-dependent oxidoreductase
MTDEKRYDIAVVGGGIVGLSTALAAGQAGASVALVDRGPAPQERSIPDGRTAALLDPAIVFLDRLGVWAHLAKDVAPLKALRIVNLNAKPTIIPHTLCDPSGSNMPGTRSMDGGLLLTAAPLGTGSTS